jgi:hypothetical protein
MQLPRSIYHGAAALGLACSLPAVAHATVVYDEITVQDSLGNVLASVTASPDDLTDPYGVFYVPGIAVDETEYGDFGIVVDNDGNPLELFGIASGGPDGDDLAFALQGIASAEPLQNSVLATGAPIDMTQFLDPALQAAGDTASFIVSDIPEPSSWAMMVVGFAAMGWGMRRTAQTGRTSRNFG